MNQLRAVQAHTLQLNVCFRRQIGQLRRANVGFGKLRHDGTNGFQQGHNKARFCLSFQVAQYLGALTENEHRQTGIPGMRALQDVKRPCRHQMIVSASSKQKIPLRHRQHFGRRACQKLAICAHLIGRGGHLDLRRGVVQDQILLADVACVLDRQRLFGQAQRLADTSGMVDKAYLRTSPVNKSAEVSGSRHWDRPLRHDNAAPQQDHPGLDAKKHHAPHPGRTPAPHSPHRNDSATRPAPAGRPYWQPSPPPLWCPCSAQTRSQRGKAHPVSPPNPVFFFVQILPPEASYLIGS